MRTQQYYLVGWVTNLCVIFNAVYRVTHSISNVKFITAFFFFLPSLKNSHRICITSLVCITQVIAIMYNK